MRLPQILNVTHAWLASQFGWDAVRVWLAEKSVEPEPAVEVSPILRAKAEAEENMAGVQALSQLAALPRAGR